MVYCPHCGHGIEENSLMFKHVKYQCGECRGRFTLELAEVGWKAVAVEEQGRKGAEAQGSALGLIRR